MANICEVCQRDDRWIIERRLGEGRHYSTIAREFGLTSKQVRGHVNHLNRAVAKRVKELGCRSPQPTEEELSDSSRVVGN